MGKRSRSRSRSKNRHKSRERSEKRRKSNNDNMGVESRLTNLEQLMQKIINSFGNSSTEVQSVSSQQSSVATDPPVTENSGDIPTAPPLPPVSAHGASAGGASQGPEHEPSVGGVSQARRSSPAPSLVLPAPRARRATNNAAPPPGPSDRLAASNSGSVPTVCVSAEQGQMHKLLSGLDNIPVFTGNAVKDNMSAQVWLKRLESFAKIYNWNKRFLIHQMTCKFAGNARLWFDSQQEIDFTWEQWKTKILCNFPEGRDIASKLYEFVTVKREINENVLDFYYKKLSLGKKCDQPEHVIVDVIIFTLNDPLLRAGARGAACRDTRSLLQYLTDAASDCNMSNKSKSSHTNIDVGRSKPFRKPLQRGDVSCYKCGAKGHFASQCTKTDVKRCDRCSKFGHITVECKEEKQCTNCRKWGHDVEHCYQLKKDLNTKPPKLFRLSDIDVNDRKYHKTATVNNVQLSVYVDFGSACNTITASAVARTGLLYTQGSSRCIRAYGGSTITPIGELSAHVSLDQASGTVPILVVEDGIQDTDMIIGRTFTELPNILVTKTCNELTITNIETNDMDQLPHNPSPVDKIFKLSVVNDTTLYEGFNKILVSMSDDDKEHNSDTVMVKCSRHRAPGREFDVIGGPIRFHESFGEIKLICHSHTPLNIYASKCIARACAVSEDCVNTDLVGEDSERLEQLLHSYDHCFAGREGRIGASNIEMSIELTSNVPFYYRPYRMSCQEQEKVKQIVDDLLQQDIIEPSNSPYASRIILVSKKNGDARMCVDYRHLNSLTRKDRYPLPLIQDQIDQLKGQKYFSTLDLCSGYHQLWIHPDSRKYTSFVTPFGQYQYKRMPFGLSNAPAAFQRAINQMLGDLRFKYAGEYLDDIICYSETVSEGLDRLESILKLISESGLTLRKEKCAFLKTKIEYLGFDIAQGEVRPSPRKLESVEHFPKPGTVHQLRQFIGLASYFRKFIASFALRARPLTILLKKNAPWRWEKAQDDAFDEIKAALVSQPVLAIYNDAFETQVHTDASSLGIAGVLMQKQSDGEYKPVAYASRQTTNAESKYHSYELEALAVVMSLKKFRVYLLGKPFTVVTDCNALSTTWTKRDMVPRIGRWWLELLEYEFKVIYRPGKHMQHADALSRNPIDSVLHLDQTTWVVAVQQADSKLNILIQDLKSNNSSDSIKSDYCLVDCTLCKVIDGKKRIVIPKSVRWRIVKMFHDDNGHMCEQKVIDLIRKKYWFEKLRRFVTKYVKSCISCQFAKKPTGIQRGKLNPIDKGNLPFETIHVDHLGPFCESKEGNTYILLAVDGFTKYTWLQPVPNTRADHVLTTLKLLEKIFGTPARIISDRGKCFASQQMANFCASRHIKHIMNAVACPRANGQVERVNKTVLQSLTACIGDKHDAWEDYLSQVQRGINSTVSSSTGKSPFDLTFGFMPRFPLDVPSCSQDHNIDENRKQAADRLKLTAERMKLRYDRNRIPALKFNLDDQVQIERRVLKKGITSGKLVDKYAGPYKVIAVLPNDRYRVESLNNRGRKYRNVIAADKMKPFKIQENSDIESDAE